MNSFCPLIPPLCVLFALASTALAADAQPPGGALAGQRPRVIISTDIGGSDPDDFQSMVHLFVYADLFDIEGLVSSPPRQGRAKHIHEVIDAYEKDYPNLLSHSARYPKPKQLREVTKQGAIDPAPEQGFSEPTEGSKWIVARAQVEDQRPLWILGWGSITDVAQAVHDAPGIKQKIRVYSIGSWNTKEDPAARKYLFQNHKDLWWIEADTTFRGMYMGGAQEGDLGNRTFPEKHIQGHGALGAFFMSKKPDIKMGDTPSALYLLRGNADDPASDHWGGAFVKQPGRPNYWHDNQEKDLTESGKEGAKTVNRWREAFLRDWQTRMERTTRRQ